MWIVLVSSDGIHWAPRTASGSLYGIASNGERLVAVGAAGAITTSLDGDSWTNRPSPYVIDLNAVTWTGAKFVAVGKNGAAFTSPDGLDWSSSGPGGGKNLKGIA